MVTVSVIMPAYNAGKYIKDAINCIINQSFKDWELIIIDDGSTDNTYQIAKTFESERIRIFSFPNAGAAAARNYGYKLSKGSYIKFFDADDLINSQMLEEQVKLAILHPDSIISAQWGRFFNNDISTFKIKNTETNHDLMPIDWICQAWKNAKPMHQCGIFLLPRQIIEKAGLWDESLSLNDDMEFFTRNILAAQSVVFCKMGTLYYRSGGNNNLSSTTNKKAIDSLFNSIDKSTKYLLAKKNDYITQKLTADIWQKFVYDAYLFQSELTEIGELRVLQYGGSLLKIHGGRRVLFLTRLLGWKMALKIDYLLKIIVK